MNEVLYREEILEHYRNPQNFGRLKKYSISSRQTNPFCGDDIEMFVQILNDPTAPRLRGASKVQNIGFVGQGCAISIAAASIITEYSKGKRKSVLTKFSEENMLELLGVEVSRTRRKCALLALATLKDCL